ncbi:amino acid adenylation domain-containing protein [Phyllobacterium chamaecytisi]|uniref:amino acid adenylation domain-containing protein n=1 Tax=Phyllobacterium chamaecytisi TaxID=2876082 RepID=UPI001CCC1703|nr:amino acid adenylation domain-containing protein [Phyllobacterium sp. KW56]MBZ9603129.1 amino acid adenylation domain-containing protein [Phyllobacterium sp. KW56]
MTKSTLIQQLKEQVLRHPDRVAVSSDSGSLTFAELWRRSGQVAAHLRNHGVKADAVVGVFVDSSLELEIAIWAVLRSGGAYLPLSPEYPSVRLRYSLEDSGARIILTTALLESDARTIQSAQGAIVRIEDCLEGGSDDAEQDGYAGSNNLAYVIYTSGSTGKPKGVAIEHGSIAHQLDWLRDAMGINEDVRILQKTPFSFDAAQWEILSIALGATVVMAGIGTYRDPSRLVETAKRHAVTTLQCVPTLWMALLETDGFQDLSLAQIFSGGEALTSRLARNLIRVHPSASLVNLYGPTETTINVSAYTVRADELDDTDRVLPIGFPVYHTDLIVCDGARELADGEVGELCITGPQLARGYIGNAELTAAKFTMLVDAQGRKRRVYRTGDLAIKGAADGVVGFLGRVDNQVKISGHRIELDEIRLAIENHRWIRRATVVPWQTRRGTPQLAAFVELDETEAALMDQNISGSHHKSKASRRQVNAQLSNGAFRLADELDGNIVSLPSREAPEDIATRAFARKTYRNFRTRVRGDQIVEAIRSAQRPPLPGSTHDAKLDKTLIGRILRWFGPFSSDTRLLPKYAYASPGALNASQIFVEAYGVEGLSPGLYYFHPADHTLTHVSPLTPSDVGIRLHVYGKRSRIREVYSTNVDEVLHLEAGHMLGLLEEVAVEHGLYPARAAPPHSAPAELFSAEDYLHTLSVKLARPVVPEPLVKSLALVQIHEETPDGVKPGTYGLDSDKLTPIGDPIIRRKDVIAINQAVFDRSTFGIALIVAKQSGWEGFVELGRFLHRLQTSDPEIGLMSSGYSSLSGYEMATSIRLDALIGKDFFSGNGTISYFALGGGISSAQRSSRGMEEDLVHMRGPTEILKDDLRELLPEYMVPSRVKVIDTTPTMPSGKIDLQSLRNLVEAEESARPIVPPGTRTELEVAGIWKDILGLEYEELSIRDSFFDVGGNSLSAMALINRLNARFGTRLPIQALFAVPTVEALASEIGSGAVALASRLVSLNEAPVGSPIYCWPGLGGYPMILRSLAQAADQGSYRFLGVQAHGINPDEVPFTTIQEMAAADVELIQRHDPTGPITCIGYSFGARVAFETAYQLEQLGRTVERIVLIAPGSPLQKTTAAAAEADRFEDERFLRILLSVFAGTLNSPLEAQLLASVGDERAFIDFITSKFEDLSTELVARIVTVVKATFSFEYTFDELSQRAVRAPITLIKAQGDDYSFLETASSSQGFSQVIELSHDHYSILRGDGQMALAQVLSDVLSSDREISMPHISVKHFPAHIDEGRRKILADELASAVIKAFGCAPNVVSVALEPVEEANWDALVYQPEIIGRQKFLVREPSYGLRQNAK